MRMIPMKWVSVFLVMIAVTAGGQVSAQSSSSSSATSGSSSSGTAPLPPLMSGYVVCATSTGQTCSFSGTRAAIADSCFESLCSRRTFIATGPFACFGWTSSAVVRCAYSQSEMTATRFTDLTATASTQSGSGRVAAKAVDGDAATRWEASNSTAGSWLQVKRVQPFYLARIEIAEFGQRIRGYRVEYLSGSSWLPLQEGVNVGPNLVIDVGSRGTILTTGVRIITTGTATGQPSISEISVTGISLPPQI